MAIGQSIDVSDGMSLGRADSNSLSIPDQTVSGSHAEIHAKSGVYTLVDLNSTNGTLVNGQKTSQTTIKIGDRIQFGKVNITIK